MALQFRNLNSSDMTFLTSPSAGTGTERTARAWSSRDKTKAAALYNAVGTDKIAEWLAANPPA